MIALGILGASVVTAITITQAVRSGLTHRGLAARGTESPAGSTPPGTTTSPVDAIFRLEDELAMLGMNADRMQRILDVERKPNIPDPTAFLVTLNTVRRQLEGAESTGESNTGAQSLQQFNFKAEAKSFDFYRMNRALGDLDDVLSSRYDPKVKDWRTRVLAALAQTRRELIAICEPVGVEAAGNTKDGNA